MAKVINGFAALDDYLNQQKEEEPREAQVDGVKEHTEHTEETSFSRCLPTAESGVNLADRKRAAGGIRRSHKKFTQELGNNGQTGSGTNLKKSRNPDAETTVIGENAEGR